MKKYILPVLAISMLIAMPVFGAIGDTDVGPVGVIPAAGNINIWTLLTKALNWFFNIVIIIAAILIVSAGYRYMTAGGDETKVKSAMNNLIFALVGIGVAVLAKGLIYIVSQFVTGTGVTF